MTKELTQFKYEQLDESTADFLRQKESNMREIVGKAYTELGKELYEAQQRLAGNNQYDGVFNRWLDYMDYPRRTAYELIARYKELVRIPHKQKNTFEALPISLSKTISAKSSEDTPEKAQAKTEVLAGDIATLKEYRELYSRRYGALIKARLRYISQHFIKPSKEVPGTTCQKYIGSVQKEKTPDYSQTGK